MRLRDGPQEPPKVRETLSQVACLSAQSQSEMIRHPEETTLRNDGLVLPQQSTREFRDVHRAVGEQHAAARGDVLLKRRHLTKRVRGDFPVHVENPPRPTQEEIPAAQGPSRNRL